MIQRPIVNNEAITIINRGSTASIKSVRNIQNLQLLKKG